ncbi:peptidoglycan amidohydrolase family protein [Enterococcus sp. AZ196]|uniref:peptidoglycan amidohydrolase family protein n=1 Tax=Enterococcus sp. AZ196 TaxID=2774659 RepID=UPI003D2751BC
MSRSQKRKGNLFIAGIKGNSAGGFGHTGIETSNSRNIHCNYTDNGISETVILNRTENSCYWFRFIKKRFIEFVKTRISE